jgi:hypothetical protein
MLGFVSVGLFSVSLMNRQIESLPLALPRPRDLRHSASQKFGNLNHVRALKMRGPSTGATYVATAPPNTDKVSTASDWMFDTEHFLQQVGQQS